jgi:hypothetical protein
MSFDCIGCKQQFNSLGLFERHRVGDHTIWEGNNRRRCLTVEEMQSRKWEPNKYGKWVDRSKENNWFKVES